MIEEVETIAPWIQTLGGRAFDFEDMPNNAFDQVEVASVLSRIPRFAGHTRWPYTVAQHCVLIARKFDDDSLQLTGLLHDATKAFVGDISAPLKHWLKTYGGTTALKDLERRIWNWIATDHRLDPALISEIRDTDMAALATEARDLMHKPPRPWCKMPPPWPTRIEPWCSEYAKDQWLQVYYELVGT